MIARVKRNHDKPAVGSGPAARFSTTRAAHRDETAQDYVEAIDHLIAAKGEARVRDLAGIMGVSHVTVSKIIGRIEAMGLVIATAHHPVRLTPKGRALARRTRECHETVLAFLRAIGVPPRQAEIDAEGIEHHVSAATIRAMKRLVESMPGR